MCFSASASFIASAVLFAGGVAAVKLSTSRLQLPFAIIPFISSFSNSLKGSYGFPFPFLNFQVIRSLLCSPF